MKKINAIIATAAFALAFACYEPVNPPPVESSELVAANASKDLTVHVFRHGANTIRPQGHQAGVKKEHADLFMKSHSYDRSAQTIMDNANISAHRNGGWHDGGMGR